MRFIRDIIDEKKSDSPPNEARDFGVILEDGMADKGGASAAPNQLSQETADAMQSPSLPPQTADERALRNIFKTEVNQELNAGSDGGNTELHDEPPEPEHPREPFDAVQSQTEHVQEPFGDPENYGAKQNQTPTFKPASPVAPPETGGEPRDKPTTAQDAVDATQPVEVPQPAAGRMLGRSGRVKTRVLGFGQPQHAQTNVFDRTDAQTTSTQTTYPVGWLVVVNGPGVGSAFTLYSGVSSIGRSPDETIALAFGDNSISRENHAAIAYDAEQRSFFLGHGGKTNLVRLNARPVLSTEELKSDDEIRIGETTLRFIALCGEKFSWSMDHVNGVAHDAAE